MCINRLVKLNPVNFDEEVLCSDIPVLVGFCASWSKAGRGVEALLSRISVLEAGRVKVCKFNVDEDPMFGTPARSERHPYGDAVQKRTSC